MPFQDFPALLISFILRGVSFFGSFSLHKQKERTASIDSPIERGYEVTVSVQSIQYWMKRDEHGDLVLFQTNVIQQLSPKQVIDKEKFLNVFGKLFETSDRKFAKVQKRILEEFDTDRIEKALKEMPPLELMRLYRMSSNEKQKTYKFVLNVIGRTDDEGVEGIAQLFDQVEKAIESSGASDNPSEV